MVVLEINVICTNLWQFVEQICWNQTWPIPFGGGSQMDEHFFSLTVTANTFPLFGKEFTSDDISIGNKYAGGQGFAASIENSCDELRRSIVGFVHFQRALLSSYIFTFEIVRFF